MPPHPFQPDDILVSSRGGFAKVIEVGADSTCIVPMHEMHVPGASGQPPTGKVPTDPFGHRAAIMMWVEDGCADEHGVTYVKWDGKPIPV